MIQWLLILQRVEKKNEKRFTAFEIDSFKIPNQDFCIRISNLHNKLEPNADSQFKETLQLILRKFQKMTNFKV